MDVLSRETLYEQVWSEPLTKLAPKFGISDVGLAKICSRHQIPRPPVGHWAKLAHGKASARIPLPVLDDESLHEIRLFRRNFEHQPPQSTSPVPEVKVGDRLLRPHRLIDQARTLLRNASPSRNGVTIQPTDQCLGISVTQGSLTRALRILDALIKHWEAIGGSVSAGESATWFTEGEDRIGVTLTEQITRHEKPSSSRYWKEHRYEPSGRLILRVDTWASGPRKTWSDGKKQKLELLLGKVCASLRAWIGCERTRRLDRECEARQEQVAKQVRQVAKAHMEAEEKRIDQLEHSAAAWTKADQIRSYLAALQSRVEAGNLPVQDIEGFEQWIEWAHWFADSTCPITKTPARPNLEDTLPPSNLPISELDLTSDAQRCLESSTIKDTDELWTLNRNELTQRCGENLYSLFSEVTRVLEGLGYDVTSRRSLW